MVYIVYILLAYFWEQKYLIFLDQYQKEFVFTKMHNFLLCTYSLLYHTIFFFAKKPYFDIVYILID